MRRLLRWAFDFTAVVSAVLFVAVCVLWVRSPFVVDRLEGTSNRLSLVVLTEKGEAIVGVYNYIPGGGPRHFVHETSPVEDDGLQAYFGTGECYPGGFAFSDTRLQFNGRRAVCFAVPLWFPAAVLALFVAIWVTVRRRRRSNRRPAGRCPACGYDLRATPDEGGSLLDRCPECGHVPEKEGAKA